MGHSAAHVRLYLVTDSPASSFFVMCHYLVGLLIQGLLTAFFFLFYRRDFLKFFLAALGLHIAIHGLVSSCSSVMVKPEPG